MLLFVWTGIRGYVLDVNNRSVEGAYVDVVGQRGFVKSTTTGEYWKVLLPGTHRLQVGL